MPALPAPHCQDFALRRRAEVLCCLHTGTVLAATISAQDGGGYASGGTAVIIAHLRATGIFARPLGNVVYLMVTPTSSRATCAWLLQELAVAVQAAQGQPAQAAMRMGS